MRRSWLAGRPGQEVVLFHPDGPTLFELAQQALSSTERGYDLLAPKFDHTPFRTPDEILKPIAEWIGSFDRGVDLCCGTGAAMQALRAQARESLTGVDSSQGMLAIAAGNVADAPGEAAISLVRADVLGWKGEGRFDLAVSFGAFGHILRQDEPAFARVAFEALKPGGRFVFVTSTNPGPLHPGWWMAHGFNTAIRARNLVIRPAFHMYYLTFLWPQVERILRDAGFEVSVHADVFEGRLAKALVVEARRPEGT
ncbi:MAG: class I SAM-dependent methyltransferase [Myxococcota bacterium]